MVSIFVSHAWFRDDLYRDLISLLDQHPEFRYTDVSIPRERAVEIWDEGEREADQEMELQQERERTVSAELLRIEAELREYDQATRAVSRLRSDDGIDELRRTSGERAAAFEREWRAEYVARAQALLAAAASPSTAERLERLRGRSRQLQLDRQHARERLRVLSHERTGYRLDTVLRSHGKISLEVEMNRNLSLALHNRIQAADVVVRIGESVDSFRTWLDFEFNAACDLGKATVWVRPPDAIPSAPDPRIDAYSRWESAAVVASILKALRQDSR